MDIRVEPNTARGGINLWLDPHALSISPTWRLGGFSVSFVHLPAGQTLDFPENVTTYAKIIHGATTTRRAFPEVGAVRTTAMGEGIQAACDTVLCIISETSAVPDKITDMSQLLMSGSHAECLQWQTFDEKFRAVTDIFRGLEAYMVPGFHLLDAHDHEIAYVHFWTSGKGVDVSTHNHSHDPSELAPAFAETHLVLRNGTGRGGMYECESPQASDRKHLIVGTGEEHGPFFRFDPDSGTPVLRENGAVEYPWHGWQGGDDGEPGQSYDVVAAFEISPRYTNALAADHEPT